MPNKLPSDNVNGVSMTFHWQLCHSYQIRSQLFNVKVEDRRGAETSTSHSPAFMSNREGSMEWHQCTAEQLPSLLQGCTTLFPLPTCPFLPCRTLSRRIPTQSRCAQTLAGLNVFIQLDLLLPWENCLELKRFGFCWC